MWASVKPPHTPMPSQSVGWNISWPPPRIEREYSSCSVIVDVQLDLEAHLAIDAHPDHRRRARQRSLHFDLLRASPWLSESEPARSPT